MSLHCMSRTQLRSGDVYFLIVYTMWLGRHLATMLKDDIKTDGAAVTDVYHIQKNDP